MQSERTIVDGAYGTLLASQTNGAAELLLTRELDTVRAAHEAYVRAGAQEIQTCTFMTYARPVPEQQAEYQLGLIAARRASSSQQNVMLTVGPSTEAESFDQALRAAASHNADGVVVETITSQATLKALAQARATLPDSIELIVCGSVDPSQEGAAERVVELVAWADAHDATPGLNCCSGPDSSLAPVISPLARRPGARLVLSSGVTSMLAPAEWAARMRSLANLFDQPRVGGCCGTTPDHIAALLDSFQGS